MTSPHLALDTKLGVVVEYDIVALIVAELALAIVQLLR